MPARPLLSLLLAAALLGAALLWPAAPAQAGDVFNRLRARGLVRVCIWPDYYGITWRNPRTGRLSGLDIDLSAEFARELGLGLSYVDSSFGALVDDLLAERCDIAMHAVAVLPVRAEKLAFTRPYLRSGIVAITTRSQRRLKTWDDIDRDGVKVAVQAGTFMEPVMATRLKQAQLVVVRPPQSREQELEAGRVDVFMTDYPYSRRLLDQADWARLITPPEPVHPLPYAYALKPGDAEWLQAADAFVERIRRDGRLAAIAARHGLAVIVER
ncbi:amino acid ABC transporter substrate-binding protein [Aquincola sp. S2]|uniref:Amino acid ABC transporter substrate-binding protein n=1 Tax=Pseudaquabacterium terrae TaxID=2732868 RepID=A0ABX2EGX6_9BURK|nr:ABC transporter substrate-binding protein [Aquabacterium terrae]NRF67877.1 amino acid ABC transporter substrate-binding protein [Aquabacterium terrae]